MRKETVWKIVGNSTATNKRPRGNRVNAKSRVRESERPLSARCCERNAPRKWLVDEEFVALGLSEDRHDAKLWMVGEQRR